MRKLHTSQYPIDPNPLIERLPSDGCYVFTENAEGFQSIFLRFSTKGDFKEFLASLQECFDDAYGRD
jgi:hypothetical protein